MFSRRGTSDVPIGVGIRTEVRWIESAEVRVNGVCEPTWKHHDRSHIRIEVSKKVFGRAAEDENVTLAEVLMGTVNREHPAALHDAVERVLLMSVQVQLQP